jgi:hypothetical protein
MIDRIILIWPDAPVVSIVVWLLVIIALLYMARTYAHRAFIAFGRVIHDAMRVTSRSILTAEGRLKERNREVLLASGAEHFERLIEREFHRVEVVVERDLQAYPALHRSLADIVIKIEEDYTKSTEVPPSPPGWIEAIDAVANIPLKGDPIIGKMLGEINKTLKKHHEDAISVYRKESSRRHALLKKMFPYWRKIKSKVGDIGKTIVGLQARAQDIDNHMSLYEEIRRGSDKARRILSSSDATQFVIASFVMLIAIGGAFINFHLIALPMSEMVGGGNYIGNFRTADVAALVIILVELTMGLYLMESLRITRLFPVIGALDDRLRVRMIWISLFILFLLAGVESALAFMRDQIAMDMQALRQTLAGTEVAAAEPSMIPMVGQMVLGFILPFALTFVAIPLESFIHTARTLIGGLMEILLRWTAFLVRFVGILIKSLMMFLIRVYDLLIFIPLNLEQMYLKKRGTDRKKEETL